MQDHDKLKDYVRSGSTWLRVCGVQRNEDVCAAVCSHGLSGAPGGHTGQAAHHSSRKGGKCPGSGFYMPFCVLYIVLYMKESCD